MTIETFDLALATGITLSCRACGPADAPRIVFVHGFPEAAFVWDGLLEHFDRYRCVAPNLRGYERSSAPPQVEAYRAKHLVADLVAMIGAIGAPVAAVVAHDWGGAVAWNLAAQRPDLLGRLVIVNSPHPATFLRELRSNPAQQRASAYMNFLCRPDAARLLAENDYARLWPFFGAERPAWLDEATQRRYRDVWERSLETALNYYRASPLRPPTADHDAILKVELDRAAVTVRVPTRVVWAEADIALLPALVDGLDAFVPALTLRRVPRATHWIVHEQPDRIAAEIAAALGASA